MGPLGAGLAALALTTTPGARVARVDNAPGAFLLEARHHVPRRLVADFRAPQAVVVPYAEDYENAFIDLVETITRDTSVFVIFEGPDDSDMFTSLLPLLEPATRDRVWATDLVVDSAWIRDYGPLQVRDDVRGLVWLDASYEDDERPLDDSLPLELARPLNIPVLPWEVPLDGGALSSNGDGLCVSTRHYLESWEIDYRTQENALTLLNTLGCQIMVLVPAVQGEPTGHVDMFVQFVDRQTVVLAEFDAEQSPRNAARMETARRALATAAGRMGLDLAIHRIHTPAVRGRRYRSAVNALQLPSSIVIPAYHGREAELDRAVGDWQAVRPDHDIVSIDISDWDGLGGAIHCATLGLELDEQ